MPTVRQRSWSSRWMRALIAGVVCTAIFTYGPGFIAWCKPSWMGNPARRVFSHGGRDFDTAVTSGRFAWLGYERLEATPYRGIYAINPVSTASRDIAVAEQVTRADEELLGPLGESTLGRTGLLFYRQRAGFPFTAVEASVCLTFGASPGFQRVVGGTRIESGSSPHVWLVPWGVKPLGLAGNVAFWTLVVGALPFARAWRYRTRLNAGLCTACGYDRRGVPAGPCPECGDPG